MNSVTKWSYRLGLASGLCALIGGICLTILGAVAPAGTMGNRQAAESVVGILTIVWILLGFVVFLGALRAVRETSEQLSTRAKHGLMIALIATSFFGGYIFFLSYPRLRLRPPS